jgi:catalase
MKLVNVSATIIDTTPWPDVICPIAVDFEQPRNLYTKVLSDADREHLVHNIAANLRNVKSAEIKARQRKFFLTSYPISFPRLCLTLSQLLYSLR